jgi:hypothetical protein
MLTCFYNIGEHRPVIMPIFDIPNDDGVWVNINFKTLGMIALILCHMRYII